jgi:hypothetical protein
VTDAEYRRELLLTRIEAHRTVLRLELRCARATLHPLDAVLSLLGVDAGVAGTVAASLRAVLGGPADVSSVGTVVPLVVAALLPLVDGLRSREPAAAPSAEHGGESRDPGPDVA